MVLELDCEAERGAPCRSLRAAGRRERRLFWWLGKWNLPLEIGAILRVAARKPALCSRGMAAARRANDAPHAAENFVEN
jgi:hypothetical protein